MRTVSPVPEPVFWSVWHFRNVAGTVEKTIVRPAAPGEDRFQSEYCLLLGQCWAVNRQTALSQVISTKL